MDNPVAKALHDGLDTLRERGLTKYTLLDENTGGVCSMGALIGVTVECPWGERDRSALKECVRMLNDAATEQYPDRIAAGRWSRPLIDFNNHPDTTQEDVERIFEKAIVKAYETL